MFENVVRSARSAALRTILTATGHGATYTAFDTLREAERVSPEDLRRRQTKLLEDLLRHASTNVPYYRTILHENGWGTRADAAERRSPGGLHGALPNLPMLTKETLRTNFGALKSDDLERRAWHVNASGGSTGKPVKFIQDAHYKDWARAVSMLFDAWTGARVGERKVLLWGSERDLFEGKERLSARSVQFLRNEIPLNAFRMDSRNMADYLGKINRHKPSHILAYADSIFELARFAERRGITVWAPQSIMTSAGTLHPHMREQIERVFCAPVYNRYGARETGGIACECEEQSGLHISVLTHVVEVVRPDGTHCPAGETGEVLVTPLRSYSMPLLRYRTGDIASYTEEQCGCGSFWPRLAAVSGRTVDVFRLRSGGVVLPEYFIHLVGVVLNDGWIDRYQVIQDDYDHIRVKIVPVGREVDPSALYAARLRKISERVRLVMGEDCRVSYEFVERIERSPSGKYRYTIVNPNLV